MQTLNKRSRFKGVMEDTNQSGTKTWIVRVQRKGLKFYKRFPFTPRGEELAGITYKQKIDALRDSQ